MEEQPKATVAAIHDFLDGGPATPANAHLGQTALSFDQTQAMPMAGAGAGTSGIGGIRTSLLYGDPAKPGPYVLEIHVPPNTTIAAHTHRDDRVATVISGAWYFGYGAKAGEAPVKPLTAGGLYTEPAAALHFAFTRAEPAVVRLTGVGPSDTTYFAASH
jgi:hypothetical protein